MDIHANNLPAKFSAVILLAIDDLTKVENDPAYKVDMGEWHSPAEEDKVCYVCLGGSVMAKTLEYPIDLSADCYWKNSSEWDNLRVTMLDTFRLGNVVSAVEKIEGRIGETKGEEFIPDHPAETKRAVKLRNIEDKFAMDCASYRNDPAKFKKWAINVATALAAAGF